jgi:hypothetical protein
MMRQIDGIGNGVQDSTIDKLVGSLSAISFPQLLDTDDLFAVHTIT